MQGDGSRLSANKDWRMNATPALDRPFDIVINALWEGRQRSMPRRASRTARPGRIAIASFCSPELPSVRSPERHDRDRTIRRHQELQRARPVSSRGTRRGWPSIRRTWPHKASAGERSCDAARAHRAHAVGARAIFSASARCSTMRRSWSAAGGSWRRGAVRSRTQRQTLHRRDRFGVRRSGSYISVDTGKYSTAPWLAQRIAEEVLG